MQERCFFQMTQQLQGPGKVKENTFIRDNSYSWHGYLFFYVAQHWLFSLLSPPAEKPATKHNVSGVSAQKPRAFNTVCWTFPTQIKKNCKNKAYLMLRLNFIIIISELTRAWNEVSGSFYEGCCCENTPKDGSFDAIGRAVTEELNCEMGWSEWAA